MSTSVDAPPAIDVLHRRLRRCRGGLIVLAALVMIGAGLLMQGQARLLMLQARLLSAEDHLNTLQNDLRTTSQNLATATTTAAQMSDELDSIKPGSSASLSELAETVRDTIALVACSPDGSEVVTGSGSIISGDGTVLTNAHVLPVNTVGQQKGSALPCVVFYRPWMSTDEKYDAKLVGMDLERDLAVIQMVSDTGTPPSQGSIRDLDSLHVSTCATSDLRIATTMLILGYPNYARDDVDPTLASLKVTRGTISSVLADGDVVTDAKIEHGNSGGAAFLETGCFVGVPTAVITGEVETLGIIRRLTPS